MGWLLFLPVLAAAQEPIPAGMEPALLEVRVNGQAATEPVMLLHGTNGALYASAVSLQEWRIRLPAGEAVRHGGVLWYRIDNVPGLVVALSSESQMLTIDARPQLFERTRAALSDRRAIPMTRPSTGGFVNYDLFAEAARGEVSVNGAVEVGVFTPKGVGTASFVGRAGPGKDRITRLETTWTIDRPANMTTIRVGDSVSAAGPGGRPVRFGGVQYARNFAVQPGFVTMPLPTLEGSAALPSVVEIYVNDALQGGRDIAPGPFELTQVPVQSGGGTVQLVVRDLLGRQTVSEYSYYASPLLLRKGLHDFSYEIGFAREDFGIKSNRYGETLGSTTHRYGLTDRLTVEGHLQVSESVRLAGAGAAWSLFDLGLVSGSVAVSQSKRGVGTYASAGFERRSLGLSFGLRSEYHGEDFLFTGQGDFRPPRLSLSAFADMPLFGGSVGASVVHRDHRDRPDETLASVFGTFRVGRGVSVHLYARHAMAGTSETVAGAHLAVALGGRRNASASAESRDGAVSGRISYQDDPPVGIGTGWRFAAGAGDVDSVEAAVVHNARSFVAGAEVSHIEGATGVRLSAAGSLGLIGGRAFAARSLGTAFAAVKVGEQEGIRVYADNQLVGTTDARGTVIVPSLRAYDRNVIRIEEGDLPIDVIPERTEIEVRPYARAGAVVEFSAEPERGLLMQVRLEDGTPLPAGAMLRAEGGEDLWPVASGGEVYVTGIAGTARFHAEWREGSCGFSVAVPQGEQPRVAGLVCRRSDYAAR